MAFKFSGGIRRVFLAALALLVCASSHAAVKEAATTNATVKEAKPKAVASAKGPEVIIYLRNGTDVTGVITSVDRKNFVLQGPKGELKVPFPSYDGMVLNTPEEKAVGEKVTRDLVLMMTAQDYVKELRQRIRANIKIPKEPCSLEKLPLAHFQVLKGGNIQNLTLLASSGCKDFDKAILKAIKDTKYDPLPEDYTLAIYPVNYLYQLPQANPAPKAVSKKRPAAQGAIKP